MSPNKMRPSNEQDTSELDSFPTSQLFFLALCRISEPVALTSVSPYAYDLMKFLNEDTSNAAFYAGLFIAAFSFAESLTGVFWGALSDRIGRKPVLLLGCGGTLVSALVIGFATSIWVAVIGRALGGALNGNVGVVQTMVGELVKNPKHEPRAYTIMPFFWTIGTTLGPAIGGTFARPVEAFPSVFGTSPIFKRFPYLLPNLVCAGMLLLTIVLAYTLLDETHPEKRRMRRTRSHRHDREAEAPLMGPTSVDSSYGATSIPTIANPSPAPKSKSLPANLWMLILAICILSVHTMSFVQLFPIFLQTPRDTSVPKYHYRGTGGLNLSLQTVGLIMGINGIIDLAIQAVIFPIVTQWLGTRPTFLLTTTLHPLAYLSLPYLAFLPHGLWLNIGIYTWLTARNCFTMLAYPIIFILLKKATPNPLLLGRVNGLVASMCAAWRTISPPVAGFLQNVGEKHHISALAWWGFGLVALVGSVQCWFIDTPTGEDRLEERVAS